MKAAESETKRQRMMEMEIVERVSQGLPLTNDAMNYLLTHFDLQSLNRMSGTSWTMREFFKNHEVWKRKFRKLLQSLNNKLEIQRMTHKQWEHYWDVLAKGPCPDQYRLLVSFLVLWLASSMAFPTEMRHEETGITFWYVPMYFSVGGRYLFPFVVEEDEETRITKDGRAANPITGIDIAPQGSHHDLLEVLEALYWTTDDTDDKPIYAHRLLGAPDDFVTITYILLGFGYVPHGNSGPLAFKTIEACVQCGTPNPQHICGNCHDVAYCGQKCADAHWSNHQHDCTSMKV